MRSSRAKNWGCAACVGALLLAGFAAPPRALAQEPSKEATQARLAGLLQAGSDAFDEGRYEAALALYDEALQLADLPDLHKRRARCLELLGRKVEAADAYRAYLRLEPQAKDQGRIEKEISRLLTEAADQQRVQLDVSSSPAGAEVRRGGPEGQLLGRTPLAMGVEPGELTLYFSLDGHLPESRPVQAEPGQRRSLEVVLRPTAREPDVIVSPAPDTNWSLPGWLTLGAGVALAGTSAFLGWKTEDTITSANDYDRQDPSHSRGALQDLQAPISSLEAGFYATGGLALGCFLAGGLMLLLDEEPAAPAQVTGAGPRLRAWIGPAGAAWEVRF